MAGVLCNSTGPEIALLTACPLLAFAPLTNAAPPSLTVPPINLSRRLERRGSAPVDGSLACCTPHTVAPVFDTLAIRLLIPLGYTADSWCRLLRPGHIHIRRARADIRRYSIRALLSRRRSRQRHGRLQRRRGNAVRLAHASLHPVFCALAFGSDAPSNCSSLALSLSPSFSRGGSCASAFSALHCFYLLVNATTARGRPSRARRC